MKHRPRKRFSQNFLVDASVIAAIVSALRPARGEHIVEIGPGLGTLTRLLTEGALNAALVPALGRYIQTALDRG